MEKYDLWSDIQAALELEPKNSQSKIARIMVNLQLSETNTDIKI